MRTTVEFDDDVAKAVEALRRERGTGVSEAVNELVRRALVSSAVRRPPYVPIQRDLGLMVDVSNIPDALDLLEGPESR